FPRWDGAVVQVPRHDQYIRIQVFHSFHQLVKKTRLVFKHRKFIDDFSDMPIGRMDDSHRIPSFLYTQSFWIKVFKCSFDFFSPANGKALMLDRQPAAVLAGLKGLSM